MKFELRDQEEPRFAMAPMIDMVFLLLVFFMCASHLSQTQNVTMEIPTASKAVVPKERPDRWVVNIQVERDSAGNLVRNAQGNAIAHLFSGNHPTTIEDLSDQVKGRLKELPQLKVYLRADAEAPHKEMKKVMNAMAEVGVDNFIFGVYIPSKSKGAM